MREMVESFMQMKDWKDIDQARKSIMVFPGLTKAYITKESAIEFLNKNFSSDDKLVKIIFEVTINTSQDYI